MIKTLMNFYIYQWAVSKHKQTVSYPSFIVRFSCRDLYFIEKKKKKCFNKDVNFDRIYMSQEIYLIIDKL